MKSSFFFSIILLCSTFIAAQETNLSVFRTGTVEMNFLLDAGSITNKYEATSSYFSSSNSETSSYFHISILPGYFIGNGFSIEPDLSFLAVKEVKPAFSIIPNLSYTYMIPETRSALYFRAGYGLSNSYSLLGYLIRSSDKMDIGILNAGLGIKLLIAEGAALRAEVNYKRSHYEEDNSDFGFNYSGSYTLENTRLLFGFSILL